MSTLPNLQDSYRRASTATLQLTMEGRLTANVIATFRNTFPTVANYLEDQILSFKSRDDTGFNFEKRTKHFSDYKAKADKLNFVTSCELLVAAPRGLNSKYVPYLRFLNEEGAVFIKDGSKLLEDYYRVLSTFISSKEAKTSLRDYTAFFTATQLKLDKLKEQMASYFNEKSVVTTLPLYAMYERGADVVESVELSKALNKVRDNADKSDTLAQVERISELLELVIQRSNEEGIGDVSAAAADNIAQGAMVVAQYVEMLGVLRYRTEEAITATGLIAEKIAELKQ